MQRCPVFLCSIFVFLLAFPGKGEQSKAPQQPASTVAEVECRALEVHSDAAKSVTVVVFHHARESSRSRLSELLREHSGAVVEVARDGNPGNTWHGTVFRLKSCFGRGLLLLPAGAAMDEGAVFRLRLPQLRAAAAPLDHE